MTGAILFVDDKPERYAWFSEQLENLAGSMPGLHLGAADVVYAQCGPEALQHIEMHPGHVLVAVVDIDFSALPREKPLIGPDARREGMDIARMIRKAAPEMPVFLFTMAGADVSLREPGIHVMPFDSVIRRDVVSVVLELLIERQARQQGEARDDDLPPSLHTDPGIGRLRQLARSDLPLLLLGPSGTGKTCLAEWLHRASGRRGRLEVVECTRWPLGGDPNFMTAALFGQVKNAFPGAPERRGACELVSGGTLLLDEVGDLRPELQGTLLRAMERRVIKRLGGAEDLPVSFRLISATNRPPADLRSDFYFRISAGDPIHLPALRERPEDISWLARKEIARLNIELAAEGKDRLLLDGDTLRALESYDWPGNARELAQAIRNAAVVSQGGVIRPEHLPAFARTVGPAKPVQPLAPAADFSASLGEPLDSVARRYLLACWVRASFDAPRAAELADVGRATLWRTLRRAGLDMLCRTALDGQTLDTAAEALGIPAAPAARLVQDIESYLRSRKALDVEAKALELGIAADRLTALQSVLTASA